MHDAKEYIRELKFSPDGATLAVGSADATVINIFFSRNTQFITIRIS